MMNSEIEQSHNVSAGQSVRFTCRPIPIQVRKCAIQAPSVHAGNADLLFSREDEDATQANHKDEAHTL